MTNYEAAIVTGASSGIGASIAKQLCEREVVTYALARSTEGLQHVHQTLPESKREYFVPMACDVSNTAEVQPTIEKAFHEAPINLVINNAGIGFSRDFVDFTDGEIDQVIATNLRGTINVTQAALRNRSADRRLQIVNTTSLAGKIGFPQLSIYSASKFAIEGLTEALRIEYQDTPVTFTVLRPGITDTAFFSKAGMEDYEKNAKDLKSYYSPDKVASIFLSEIHRDSEAIVVGNDKIFLALLPFIPFRKRFRFLDLINKL